MAPPLTLYHTRHCPSPSSGPPPKSLPPLPVPTDDPVTPTMINFSSNRATYAKSKTKKSGRPGTAESSKQLLPKSPGSDQATLHDTRHSLIYTHYQHSLNSLNDIIDRVSVKMSYCIPFSYSLFFIVIGRQRISCRVTRVP